MYIIVYADSAAAFVQDVLMVLWQFSKNCRNLRYRGDLLSLNLVSNQRNFVADLVANDSNLVANYS